MQRFVPRLINPLVTNGLSHPYLLDESTFILGASDIFFSFFISFFDEIHKSKQNSPRWDAAFCGVTSEAILFAYVQLKKDARLIWVKNNVQIHVSLANIQSM